MNYYSHCIINYLILYGFRPVCGDPHRSRFVSNTSLVKVWPYRPLPGTYFAKMNVATVIGDTNHQLKDLRMGRALDSFDLIGIVIAISALLRLTIA